MINKIKLKSSTFVYDSLADSLTVRFDGRNTSYSIDLSDMMIIDFSDGNKVAGMEFLGLSELYDFKKEELNNISQIILRIAYNESTRELFVAMRVEFKDGNKIQYNTKEILMQPFKLQAPIFA